MSIAKKIFFGVGASWISRVTTIVLNLILIPLLFKYLGKEELGLWFLLANSQAFLNLLGFGLAPTITRKIALARGKEKVQAEADFNEEVKQEVGDLLVTGNIVLRWLSVIVFILSCTIGSILITSIDLQEVTPQTVITAWIIISLGYAIGVWVEYINCLLTGLGYVGFNQVVLTIANIVSFVLKVGVVLLGGGLIHLAFIIILSFIGQRVLLITFIKRFKPFLLNIKGTWNPHIAKSLIKPAFDFWLNALGLFIILKSDQYFIALMLGVKDISNYHATYQMVSNLRVLNLSIVTSSAPFLGQMWKSENLGKIHQLVKKVCLSGWLIIIIGSSFLIVSGKELMEVWIGDNAFVGYGIMVTFCLMFMIESQNLSLSRCSRAVGYDRFGVASLFAAGLNIVLTYFFIQHLGLWGVSLATLISLSLSEGWYVPLKALQQFKISFPSYFKDVIFVAIAFFLVNLSLLLVTKKVITLAGWDNPLINLIATAVISGITFIVVILKKVKSKQIS